MFTRLSRVQVKTEGLKRSLLIKKCAVEDGGTISAKTNVDCVTTKLLVKCKFPSYLSNLEQCKHKSELILLKQNIIS